MKAIYIVILVVLSLFIVSIISWLVFRSNFSDAENEKQYKEFVSSYKKNPRPEPWELDTTILVKTFLRPSCLRDLIRSIRSMYSRVPIVVVDDGDHPFFSEGENPLGVYCIYLPFDSGISIGRNAGVNFIRTKYTVLVDDDMLFTKKSKMNILFQYLENNPGTDLIAAKLSDRKAYRALYQEMEPGVVSILEGEYLFKDGVVTYSHRALNCFMCKTRLLREIPWDDNLKVSEHTEHFYRMYLAGVVICDTPEVEIGHAQGKSNPRYSRYRNRSNDYRPYILNKHNLTKLGD